MFNLVLHKAPTEPYTVNLNKESLLHTWKTQG